MHLPNLLLRTTRIQDESLRRRATVLNVLFIVTFAILSLATLAICIAYFSGFNRLVLHRLFGVALVLGIVGTLYASLRRKHYFVAASGLLGIYWLLATVMALTWGVILPATLLLFCTLIVLSGIVLGAGYSIVTLITSSVVLFIIELLTVRHTISPNFYWQTQPQHLSDLVGYYFAFTVIGVCSWLFNRQTDISLHRALRAEAALQREKELLELKVESRTRELEAAQLDKMQQMYRFAQLGQFTTSLFHDLGNHMTTLSLDIEGMSEQVQSKLQKRIKNRIAYVDAMVQWAYAHINETVQPVRFNVADETRELLKVLQYDATTAHVRLRSLPKEAATLTLYGDPTRYRQLIANLVGNAVDAYPPAVATSSEREVVLDAKATRDGGVRITVTDHGKGIPADIQTKVFDPFYTTKQSGTGIGLFVVRQLVEDYFGGKIKLTSKPGNTTITVTLYAVKDEA
jgi:signal transduction histidine kinase